MTVLVGQTTSGTSADSAAAGNTVAFPFVASANGTAVTIFCQLKVANATFSSAKLGFYSNGAGVPGTLLDSATVLSGFTGTGQFQATLTGAVSVVSGTTYWLAFSGSGEQIDLQGVALAGKEGTGVMGASGSFSGSMSFAPIIWIEDAGGVASAGYTAARPMLFKLRQFQLPGVPRIGFPPQDLSVPASGAIQTIIPAGVSGTSAVTATVVRVRALATIAIAASSAVTATVVRTRALAASAVNGTSAVTAAVVRTRALATIAINGTSAVSATVVRARALTAAVAASSAVSASVVRTRALTASVNGLTVVSGAVVKNGSISGAVNGNTTVTATVVRTRAVTASVNGTSTVSLTSIVRTRPIAGTVNGTSTVTAAVVLVGSAPTSVGNGTDAWMSYFYG